MSLSINTNSGATVALQSLNRTNRELDTLQKRVSTGFRVSDAKDDGAAFAIAQGLRGKIKAYDSLNQRLEVGKGKLAIHALAVETMAETTANIGKVLVKLADESLSADERATYVKEYSLLKNEISRAGNASGKSTGFYLLDQAGSFNYLIQGVNGSNRVVPGMYITHSVYMGANLPNVNNATDAKNLLAPGGGFRNHENLVANAAASLGRFLRGYENEIVSNEIMMDTIQNAIGAMVDADLAKDSARMEALQIRQQLGTQTLNIANQAPSAILQLFK